MKTWKRIDKHPVVWGAVFITIWVLSDWIVEGLASLIMSLL
jgi:hypothetical protein